MKRSIDQILTTHVGSLPRAPAALAQLRARNAGEAVNAPSDAEAMRHVIDEVVSHQVDIGLTVVNDGEQNKFAYYSYHLDRLSGFELALDAARITPMEGAEGRDYPEYYARWPQRDGAAQIRQHVCTGPIAYHNTDAIRQDIENLKSAATRSPAKDVFMTAISPGMMKRTSNRYYKNVDDYEHALCDAIKYEYKAIVDAGIVLQIDAPDLGVGPRFTEMTVEENRRQVAHNIELINYATRDIAPDMMRVHVCCGADHAPHHRDPALADIVDILLTLRPAGLTVVGANGRHEHEWKVWNDVKLPDGKVLIPGVIDSTSNIIEHPEVVAERIMRYAQVLGSENNRRYRLWILYSGGQRTSGSEDCLGKTEVFSYWRGFGDKDDLAAPIKFSDKLVSA